MAELYLLTAAEAARRIRGGELSALELAEALLARVEEVEPEVQAWAYLDREGLLRSAREADEARRPGEPLGPLHGVPVGFKDIILTRGVPTEAGSRVLAGFVPDYDATCVRRLKGAGALLMGKTVTTAFALQDPGPTRNPWNPGHTPGGSSSGSAAAVAAGMCPAALGSQTTGSTLRPSSYCGVVGFKPTYGRVSRYGVIALSWSMDTVGIIARSVEDAALLLGVLAGADPLDGTSTDAPAEDYLAALAEPRPPRVGVLREFFVQEASPEVASAYGRAVEALARGGAELVEVALPEMFREAILAQRILHSVECASVHEGLFRERRDLYPPRIKAHIESGLVIPGVHYVRALRLRSVLSRELEERLRGVDVLCAPSAPSVAPRGLDSTGDPKFNAPFTYAGLPAVSLPSDFVGGLPVGTTLVGKRYREAALLAAARWCEEALGWSARVARREKEKAGR